MPTAEALLNAALDQWNISRALRAALRQECELRQAWERKALALVDEIAQLRRRQAALEGKRQRRLLLWTLVMGVVLGLSCATAIALWLWA